MIICEVFKNFAKFLQSFFNPSYTELKTVQCTVKRLNTRKLSEIRNFQKNFANYQLAPLIDAAQNWLRARGEHYVSLKHRKTCIITTKNSLLNRFPCVYEETSNNHVLWLENVKCLKTTGKRVGVGVFLVKFSLPLKQVALILS